MLTRPSLQIFTTSNFAKVRFKLYSRLQTAVQWCNVVRAVRYCTIPLYLMLPRITICITISDDNADHGTAVTRHPHVYHVYPAHVCMLYPGCHCICIIGNVNVSVSSYKSSLSDKPPHQLPSYRTVLQHGTIELCNQSYFYIRHKDLKILQMQISSNKNISSVVSRISSISTI